MKVSRSSYFTRLSRDERRLFNVAGTVSVWEIDGEKPKEKYKLNTLKNPNTLVLSSNEQLLAFNNTLGYLAVAEEETGKVIAKSKGTKIESANILFCQRDTKILASDRDGNIFTWDISSGEINIFAQLPIINTNLFSCYQETKVIIAGLDSESESELKHLRLWEMTLEGELEPNEVRLVKKYDGMSSPLFYVVGNECFFFDEQEETESIVYSLDLESKEVREVINIPQNGKKALYKDYGYYTSLCVSTDKKYLLLGFAETVIAFDLLTKERIGILRYEYTQVVSDLHFFAKDTKVLISTWSNIQAMDFPDCFLYHQGSK